MEFRERLAELIGPGRGSASRLSEAVGASRSLVQSWIKGEKKPSMEYIIALARYFSVTTDDLLCYSLENKKGPVPGMSGNGLEMLEVFELLSEREQVLLIGEARGLLLARRAAEAEPPRARVIKREGR